MFVNCLAIDFMSMKAVNAGTLGMGRCPVGAVCDSAVAWPPSMLLLCVYASVVGGTDGCHTL